MNDVEKRVRETLSKVALPSVRYVSMLRDAGTYDDAYYSALVDALSAAGLLRTDLHERALAACRALSKNSDEMGYAYLVNEYADACRHVGREALGAEKAKDEGPWAVRSQQYDGGWVLRKNDEPDLGPFVTPEAAHNACARLNAKERKP